MVRLGARISRNVAARTLLRVSRTASAVGNSRTMERRSERATKHTAGTSVQEGGGKTTKSPDVFPAEPEIQKPGAGQDFCYGIDLQNDCCGYMRQKTGEQYIRPEKSIIGNIKKAAASTQMHIIRYKAAR